MNTCSLRDFLFFAAQQLLDLGQDRNLADEFLRLAKATLQPFNLAVVGRMKAGKSTLINGIIGQPLAISDVEEATATLNWISHGTDEQVGNFIVHWRDGRSEPYPLQELANWTGKSPEVLSRIKETRFLRLFADSPKLKEIQIVDTPGTGSAVEEHEIAREFLNPNAIEESISAGGKADAIIYVVPPVGREQDEETLKIFSAGRLPNSGPYNSVAVLHKWDSLAVENPRAQAANKSRILLEQLKDSVAEVLPVSGPLALAARHASDAFFSEMASLTTNHDQQTLERALKLAERWDSDPSRRVLRLLHPMPWPSFKLIVRLCMQESLTNASAIRQRILEESGILELETFLEERFFSKTSIIKQCLLLTQAAALLEPTLRRMQQTAEGLECDAERAKQASELLENHDESLSKWLARQASRDQADSKRLVTTAVEIDRKWNRHREHLELLQLDLRVTESLHSRQDLFSPEDAELITKICNHLVGSTQSRQANLHPLGSLKQIELMISRYRTRAISCRNRDRFLIDHVIQRLEQIHTDLERL
jgi:tRNA nucleotidyltransferase/poly(A) polymerase